MAVRMRALTILGIENDKARAYKAEHTIDLDTELILSAEVYYVNEADTETKE